MLEHFYSKKTAVEREMSKIVPASKPPAEVYGLISEFLSWGGKRFRPLLCLSCCELCGGSDADALNAAAAIELFHNFTLIHDDIEDNSEMRRSNPCLHITYGLPIAINAGDGLFMMVWKAALQIPPPHRHEAQMLLLDAFTSVLEGQAMELAWYRSNRWDIAEKDYLAMAGGKTASLISASCRVGGLLGGAAPAQQERLARYGYNMGLAFQIQDDLLNIVGEEEKYKKEIGGDIREGKRTLMVIHCLSKLPSADADKMKSILSSGKAGAGEISWCRQKMEQTGSLKHASDFAQRLIREALSDLSGFKDGPAKSDLTAVASYIVEREE